MAKSTLIENLPKNDSSQNQEESNMVNSILQEIEQEDEKINDENEDSLKYNMDPAQIPPKISESTPSKDMIKEATEDLFNNQHNEVEEILNSINKKKEPNTIENDTIVSEEKKEEVNDELNILKKKENNVEDLINKIINKTKIAVVILILFILLNLPILNKYIIKCIPKFSDGNGNINMIAVIFKGIILSFIYVGISFCV